VRGVVGVCPVACVARGCQTLTHPSRKNGGAAEWVKQGHRWAVIQKRQRRVLRTSQGRRERAPECELGDPVSRPVTLDKSLQLSEHFSSYVKERLRTTRTKACALAPSQERVKSTHTEFCDRTVFCGLRRLNRLISKFLCNPAVE